MCGVLPVFFFVKNRLKKRAKNLNKGFHGTWRGFLLGALFLFGCILNVLRICIKKKKSVVDRFT
jgi:hypothetical protein